MTKTEEIIQAVNDRHKDIYGPRPSMKIIQQYMKEYAELYAKKCLEIAAQSASANFECIGAVLGAENVNPYVEVESILKIKLPLHD